MFITFTCTWVLPTGKEFWSKGQEAGGGLTKPITATVLQGPRNLGCDVLFSPKKSVLHSAEQLLTRELLDPIAQAPVSTISTEPAQHPDSDTFIFQSNVPVISINKHNSLVLICCYPLKLQQYCCYEMINPLIAIFSTQMDRSFSAWLSLWWQFSCWDWDLLGQDEWLSSSTFLPAGRQGKLSLVLHNTSPFRLTTSRDCGVNLVMTAQLQLPSLCIADDSTAFPK